MPTFVEMDMATAGAETRCVADASRSTSAQLEVMAQGALRLAAACSHFMVNRR